MAVALAWSVVLIFVMARRLLRPPRMTDGKAAYVLKRLSPDDLGLAFAPMGFTVRDARSGGTIRLAAWWIPATTLSDKTVLILHGYADAKVGGIAWAPTWQALGWNVLAIDLRAHGESGGEYCTAGFYERDDIDQVIDALRQEKPADTHRIAIFGVSLGAAVACAVAARRQDIAAVVLDSPYADYLSAVESHGRRTAMPLEHFHRYAYRVAECISGACFDDVRPAKLLPTIPAPVLVIHGAAEAFVSADQIDQIHLALAQRPNGSPSEHVIVPNAPHVMALRVDPTGYAAALRDFLSHV